VFPARSVLGLPGGVGWSLKERRRAMASTIPLPHLNERTLTKADVIEEVMRVTGLLRKEAETVVEAVFEHMVQALRADDKIEIRGFGSFHTRQRRGRVGRNPKTGEKVQVPPKRIPYFKPSKELKDWVNVNRPAASEAKPDVPGQS
jgi:integration host factor subunit beta